MNQQEFNQRLDKAKKNIREMDEIDGGDRSLGTIIAALEAGIRNPECDAHFDALAMLHDLQAMSQAHLGN